MPEDGEELFCRPQTAHIYIPSGFHSYELWPWDPSPEHFRLPGRRNLRTPARDEYLFIISQRSWHAVHMYVVLYVVLTLIGPGTPFP